MGEQLGESLFFDRPTFKGERSGPTRWPTDPWSFGKLEFFQMSPNLLNFLTVDAYGLETSQSSVFFEQIVANCQTRWFFSDGEGSNLERWLVRACGMC